MLHTPRGVFGGGITSNITTLKTSLLASSTSINFTYSASLTSQPPAPPSSSTTFSTPSLRKTETVPTAAYAGVMVTIFVIGVLAGLAGWWLLRKRGRRWASGGHSAARVRILVRDNSQSQGASRSAATQPSIELRERTSEAVGDGETHQSTPVTGQTASDIARAAANRTLQDKIRRANARRLAARKELESTGTANRVQHIGLPPTNEADLPELDRNIFALVNISGSDDSLVHVGHGSPNVNPAYQAARHLRYQQKIAQGFPPERALSISDASTDESDGPGPLVAMNDYGWDWNNPDVGTVKSPGPSFNVPQPANPEFGSHGGPTHLASDWVPQHWQDRALRETSTKVDNHGVTKRDGGTAVREDQSNCAIILTRPEPIHLREPIPTSRPLKNSWRFSQADAIWTEDEYETATCASSITNDDPFRDDPFGYQRRTRARYV